MKIASICTVIKCSVGFLFVASDKQCLHFYIQKLNVILFPIYWLTSQIWYNVWSRIGNAEQADTGHTFLLNAYGMRYVLPQHLSLISNKSHQWRSHVETVLSTKDRREYSFVRRALPRQQFYLDKKKCVNIVNKTCLPFSHLMYPTWCR